MAVAKTVRRLLHVLNLEEELQRKEFETAQSDLVRLENALMTCAEREENGRHLLAAGVQSGELADRLAGIEEIRIGKRYALALESHIDQSTSRVDDCRTALLEKQVERKQVETLVETAKAREAIEANRKAQQQLDDWYLTSMPNEQIGETNDDQS